jgi:hypothetical protein
VEDAVRTFANNSKWSLRQLYVILCEHILSHSVFGSFEAFCADFLPKLLQFRNEKVANIRVLLARVVTTHLTNNEFFKANRTAPISNELDLTVQYLQHDPDNDVKAFFGHLLTPNPDYTNDSSRMQDDASFELRDEQNSSDRIDSSGDGNTSKDHVLMMETSPPPPPPPPLPSMSSMPPPRVPPLQTTLSATPVIIYSGSGDGSASKEEDEDEEDEIIDKTKIDQLRLDQPMEEFSSGSSVANNDELY